MAQTSRLESSQDSRPTKGAGRTSELSNAIVIERISVRGSRISGRSSGHPLTTCGASWNRTSDLSIISAAL